MNFIDAHIIISNFVDAIAQYKSEDELLFIPKSKINASIQQVYDSFVVFLGHSVFFDTRQDDALNSYVSLTRFIEFIVDDEIYSSFLSDNKIVNSSGKLTSVLKKGKINDAKNRMKVYYKLYSECAERSLQSSNRFDFEKYVMLLKKKKYQLMLRSGGDFSVNDIIEYIDFVYSFSHIDVNTKEDYFFFTTFERMRNDITNNNSVFYERYKNYIMQAN